MREILSIAANSNVILWSNRKDAFSRSVIFENFDPKIAPSSQNWILTRVIEVKICDRTYGLGAICFLVLVPKPLVLSKNCTAQTPLKIQFCLLGVIFGSKLAKITAGAQILGKYCVKIPSKPTPVNLFNAWKSFYCYIIECRSFARFARSGTTIKNSIF